MKHSVFPLPTGLLIRAVLLTALPWQFPVFGQAPESPTAQALEVTLAVREDQGIDRVDEPLASGIPLPRGAVRDPGDLRVYDSTGKPIPCQAHQLGLCWPDGTLRWALVQFRATVKADAVASYTLKAQPSTDAALPPEPVSVAETADAVTVDTGPLGFTVSRTDFRLPDLLVSGPGKTSAIANCRLQLIADREHMTAEEFGASGRPAGELSAFGIADTGETKWRKVQAGVDYSSFLGGPVNIRVEENGPVRVVLRIEPAGEKTEGGMGFVTRLYAHAGSRVLRVEFSLESYEQFTPVAGSAIVNSKQIRHLSFRAKLPAETVVFGGDTEALQVAASESPSLQQFDPDAFTVTGGGKAIRHKGERAPGWMTLGAAGKQLSVATKWFWEKAPRALGYDADSGELVLELRPRTAIGYPLAAGRVKTYEFLIGVDMPGPRLGAMARAELHAYPDPEYVTATGATHRFVALADKRFSKYADYVQRTRTTAAAHRMYGDIDFGDQIGWNTKSRWNGYHGGTHEWFMFYLASGDPALFRIAEQETWHSIDVDTQHWGYLPGCREAEYARKFDHVCIGPIQGGIKAWVFGEIDYYLLTGKRRVSESLGRTANFLLNCGGVVNGHYLPQRATSLPFLHMAYLYEALGDEAALAAAWPEAMAKGAGTFRNDAVGPQWSVPALAAMKGMSDYFNGVFDRSEHMWCSFMVSYPAEAMHRFYSLTGDKTAADGVLKVADYMYNDLIVPTGIPKYAGGAPWHKDDVWVPWWDGVEAPAALAYTITNDPKYLVRAMATADWLLNYRGLGYDSSLQRWWGPLGFGGTLPTFLWSMREAGMSQDALTTLRPDIDYEQALKLCRDACVQRRELIMQNTEESMRFCKLAAEIGRVLINQKRYDEAIDWLEDWRPEPYGFYVTWALNRATALKAGRQTP